MEDNVHTSNDNIPERGIINDGNSHDDDMAAINNNHIEIEWNPITSSIRTTAIAFDSIPVPM